MKIAKVTFVNSIPFEGGKESVTANKPSSPERPGSTPAEVRPYEYGGIPGVLCTKQKEGGMLSVFVPFTNIAGIVLDEEPVVVPEVKKAPVK